MFDVGVIRKEFVNYPEEQVPFHSIDDDFAVDDTYTCIMVCDFGTWNKHFCNTRRILEDKFKSSIVQAFFATVNGPKFMAPHKNNERFDCLRCHIGIIVDNEDDGVLQVGDTKYVWRQGEYFVFDTNKRHSVYKSTEYQRTVLVVDFKREFNLA